MRLHSKKFKQLSGAAGALLLSTALVAPALAGGFAIREQSAEYQGMSFAGSATSGGGLSGMYWNPAVAAYAPAGIYSESHYAGILAESEIKAGPGSALLALGAESGDIAKDAIVGASYYSYRLSDRAVLALSINSPFGLVTEPSNRVWAGMTQARTSDIKTYNFSPTLAYRVTPTLAVGVGLQIQHMEGRLKSASAPAAAAPNAVVSGDDTTFGFTAGVNWTPVAGTHIGLGFRSSMDQTLEGTFSLAGTAFAPAAIKAGVTLPEIVTLSLRHAINANWALLGTVEWTNWSRLQKLDVVCAQGAAALCPLGQGSVINSLPLNWHDGWFVSAGLENRYSEKLTLRTGLAYEISPIQNATERTLRAPDMDRLWASIGATYAYNEKITLDFAYTHIFGIGDDKIDRTDNFGRFVGSVDTQIDIVSVALKMKMGDVPAPLK